MIAFVAAILQLTSPIAARSAWAGELELPVDDALVLLKQGQPAQAEELLLTVPPGDPDFAWAFLELQKLRYRRADWKSFFGGMVYYRHQLHQGVQLPDLLLLESMALIKHCQFQPAEKALGFVPESSLTHRGREVLGDLLAFQRLQPGNVATQADAPKVQIFQPTQEWRISDEVSKRLAASIGQPHALKVYVKNLCQNAGDAKGGAP